MYAVINAIIEAGGEVWNIEEIAFSTLANENVLKNHRSGYAPLCILRRLQRDFATPLDDWKLMYSEVERAQRAQGDAAINRDVERHAKLGKNAAELQLNTRVLVRCRKLKVGGGPPVNAWSCRAVVCAQKFKEATRQQYVKVRWLTHGPGREDVPGQTSRWLPANTDIRPDLSKTAIAHVEGIQSIMDRRQEAGKGTDLAGLTVEIPKSIFFSSKRDQVCFFGADHASERLQGVVGHRAADGSQWEVFTDFGSVELTDKKLRGLLNDNGASEDESSDMDEREAERMPANLARRSTRSSLAKRAKRDGGISAVDRSGITLWPIDQCSCHLDTFLADLTSILSFTRQRKITIRCLEPDVPYSEDEDATYLYYMEANAALVDYEKCRYGRSPDREKMLCVLDARRDQLRLKLTETNAEQKFPHVMEDENGQADIRDHIAALTKVARTGEGGKGSAGNAYRTDYSTGVEAWTFCMRRQSGTRLVGKTSCEARKPVRRCVKVSSVLTLDGWANDPIWRAPLLHGLSTHEVVSHDMDNLGKPLNKDRKRKLTTTAEALQDTVYGGAYLGWCECGGTIISKPELLCPYVPNSRPRSFSFPGRSGFFIFPTSCFPAGRVLSSSLHFDSYSSISHAFPSFPGRSGFFIYTTFFSPFVGSTFRPSCICR
jgi:hypothetical protein